MATFNEEYAPPPDISVYNPIGPNVSFSRVWTSLGNPKPAGMGAGWGNNYGWRVVHTTIPVTDNTQTPEVTVTHEVFNLVAPNSARTYIDYHGSNPTPSPPTAGSPVSLPLPTGVPVLFKWVYLGLPSGSYGFTVQFKDRSIWTFARSDTTTNSGWTTASGDFTYGHTTVENYVPIKIQGAASEVSTNYITLKWESPTYGPDTYFTPLDESTQGLNEDDPDHLVNIGSLLKEIDDSSGKALLALDYDENYHTHTLTQVYEVPNDTSDTTKLGVAYSMTGYLNYNIPSGGDWRMWLPSYLMLASVSQPSPVSQDANGKWKVNAGANQIWFDYDNHIGNDDAPGETIPYLTQIHVNSATGAGTATATINYDSTTGEVTSLVDALGNTTTFAHAFSGQTPISSSVQVTDPSGTLLEYYITKWDSNMSETERTYRRDIHNTSASVSYTAVYGDSNDPYEPSSVTNGNGLQWSMTWNPYGTCLSSTSPGTTNQLYSYAQMNYANWAMGEVQAVHPGSKTPTWINYLQPSGLIWQFTGPPAQATDGSVVSTRITYDSKRNPTKVQGPLNSSNGALLPTTHTTTIGYTTDGTYTQPEYYGQPIVITDDNGNSSHARYDFRGRMTSSWDPLGYTYTASYPPATNLAAPLTVNAAYSGQFGSGYSGATVSYYPQFVGGPLGSAVSTDEAGNVQTRTFTYDAKAQTVQESGAGMPVSFGYDGAGRQTTVTDGNGKVTTTAYDTGGFPSRLTYPDGHFIQYLGYDLAGNPTEVVDANNDSVTSPPKIVYSYGGQQGNLSQIAYQADSTMTVALTYDKYNRLTRITDSSGERDYTYDFLDNPLTERTVPKNPVTGTNLPYQTLSYFYNQDDTLSSVTTSQGNFSFSYNPDGRIRSLTNPFGESTAWSYNSNYTLSSQSTLTGAASFITNYSYYSDPNNTYTSSALSGLSNAVKIGVNQTTVSGFSQLKTMGPGNMVNEFASIPNTTLPQGTLGVGYDSTNQISGTSGRYSHALAADSGGNLTTLRGSTLSYNSRNQITGSGFVYDANGNPTTYNGVSATWNVQNQLTSFGNAGGEAASDREAMPRHGPSLGEPPSLALSGGEGAGPVRRGSGEGGGEVPESGRKTAARTPTLPNLAAGYRADGLRAWKGPIGGSPNTYFVYLGGLPLFELDSTGAVTATNTFGPNGLISRHTSLGSTFYQFDERGNTVQRYNSSGTKLSSHEVDEFGALLSGSDALADPYSGFGAQMGYYYDSETGFYLLGHRYYDPQAGRFLNQDPIGMAGGLNLYAYTGNSPMSGADPSGFCDPDDGNGWSWGDYASDVGSMFENEGIGALDSLKGIVTGPYNFFKSVSERGLEQTQAMLIGGAWHQLGQIWDGNIEVAGQFTGSLLTGMLLSAGTNILAGAMMKVMGESAIAMPILKFVGQASESGAAEGASSAEPAQLAAGRAAHTRIQGEYRAQDPNWQKEVGLDEAGRADLVNEAEKKVIEIKPNNPRGIRSGNKQLERYLKFLNDRDGGGWTGTLHLY